MLKECRDTADSSGRELNGDFALALLGEGVNILALLLVSSGMDNCKV